MWFLVDCLGLGIPLSFGVDDLGFSQGHEQLVGVLCGAVATELAALILSKTATSVFISGSEDRESSSSPPDRRFNERGVAPQPADGFDGGQIGSVGQLDCRVACLDAPSWSEGMSPNAAP